MVTAVPIAGKTVVQWLWGGYTVNNPTLHRFFSIHFFLPFLIAGMSLIHLALLHKEGSSNPIGSDAGVDDLPFYPYFVSKDVFAFFSFLVFFATFVFYFPNTLNHPDNYIPADPLHTPAHVVPEWYFLSFYAILRSIPHKAGGILAMGGAILVLLLIPFIYNSDVRNTTYRPLFKICFWLFISDFIILTWIGQKPVRDTFIYVGQVATAYYFIFFLVLIPFVGKIESALINYKSEE
jgi:ubiquinol-cytochrome c reductase cytochrome b subunit